MNVLQLQLLQALLWILLIRHTSVGSRAIASFLLLPTRTIRACCPRRIDSGLNWYFTLILSIPMPLVQRHCLSICRSAFALEDYWSDHVKLHLQCYQATTRMRLPNMRTSVQ